MKSKIPFVALFFLVFGVSGSAVRAQTAPPQGGLLDFIRPQSARRHTGVPREVLAFYYDWYGRPERQGHWVHWGGENTTAHTIPEATHYPALGAYDSQDSDVMDRHIAEAKTNGITGFIATWWGQGSFEDRAFVTLLDRAARQKFKVTVYWETAPGTGGAQVDQAVSDLVYLLRRYGTNDAFLKVDGKPVIFAYGRVMGEVPLQNWPAILSRSRARAGDFLLIADGYDEAFARLFDGIHTYNICDWVAGKTPEQLRTFAARSFADAVDLAKRHARISSLTVIPGYDDTKIRKPGLKADRQDGRTYRVLWEEALKADPDWVLITSWNEWHEGSEIEPSWEDGDQYLKLTKDYATRFTATTQSGRPALASPLGLSPDKARELRALFAGRTIGLLPDYGGAAPYWLLDAGLKLKELSWADLTDPALFNPRNFPLVLHAGGERYRRTVKTDGDVERGLQRYLSEGGFLVSIPHLPFPFYYDDVASRASPIANQLGLPIGGGWETPPVGVTLTFRPDTNVLPGLPAAIPFPVAGDLRWRPASRARVAPEDFYESLVELKDAAGRSRADGIAYVEHRTPPLRGGKTLYVWMRMPDAIGADDCLFAVFRFAAEKLGAVK